MNGVKLDAARAAILTVLRDTIDAEVTGSRSIVLDGLLEARDELGVKTIDVSLPDGTKVATVTLTEPSAQIRVGNEDYFTKWVETNYPTEVYTETKVRDTFRKQLLDRLVDAGDNDVADPVSGEIVPGVTFYPAGKPRQFSMRFTPTGRHDVVEAWQDGALAELNTPQPSQLSKGRAS